MEVDASEGMGDQERHEQQEQQAKQEKQEVQVIGEERVKESERGEEKEKEKEQERKSEGGGETQAGEPVEASSGNGGGAPPVEQGPQQAVQVQVSGPRPAPSYKAVNAVIEKRDDGPGPRCGHTLTAVAAVNEEGSPGYIGPRLILFGGATALEGSSAAGPQAASPGAGIRMFLFYLG